MITGSIVIVVHVHQNIPRRLMTKDLVFAQAILLQSYITVDISLHCKLRQRM